MDTWVIGRDSPERIAGHLLAATSSAPPAVFCFDYFDTLVVRDIEPEYTKQLAARLHSQLLDNALAAGELYRIRQELEKGLCEEHAAAGGELDFHLADFARAYLGVLRKKAGQLPVLVHEERFVQLILDIEVAVELAVQRPCAEAVAVLRALKRSRRTTVLISDFYLPGTHFRRMLKHFRLHELFDHIYISSDYGVAKGSGRLYRKICDDLGCRPDRLVMIGDNPHADVNMAREQGLAAIQVKNPAQQKLYSQWRPGDLSATGRVARRFAAASRPAAAFGEMTYSLWLFTSLLVQRLIREKAGQVFFFSKEGEFLKRLFDRYQQDLFGHAVIESHYILVSRKATFLASLRPLAEEDFSRLFAHYRDISLRDFLLSLNIEESVAATLCEELNLDFSRRFPDLQNRPEFIALKRSGRFQQEYESRRDRQRENFIRYLDSFGIDYRQEGLNIVDVGWKGSIQDNIYYILGGRVRVRGFYVGSLIATQRSATNIKTGLLFDDTPGLSPYFHVYNNNRSLFEMVLGASHGSADGYFTRQQYERLPGDHQRTVRERIRSREDELCIATLDLPEERELYRRVIQPLQEEMFAAAVALNRAYLRCGCTAPGPEWFARQHARMVFKPRREEVDFFERLYHLENFGIFEYTDFRTDHGLSKKQRLKNLKNILKDKEILESGIWPPIILRGLGLDFYRHFDGRRRYKREFK